MNEYSGNFDLNTISSVPRWIGRVVSSVSWQENIEDELWNNPNQQVGWGYRYRVRYFGLHSASKVEIPDDQLPMANVVMPVTSGSGLGGFHDTPALSPGTIVTGFFLDGMAGQEPYIDGVLINSNNKVPKQQPNDATGGLQLFNDTYKEGSPERGAFVPSYFIGTKETWNIIQSIGDKVNLGDDAIESWYIHKLDLYKPTPLASPCKSDNSPFRGIQTTIQNMLNDVKDYDTIAELFGGGNADRQAFIQKVLDVATGDVTGYVKTIFDSVRSYSYNYLQDEAKKRIPFLFPSEIPEFTKKVDEGDNIISCLFNKLVRQLPNLIGNILSGLFDKLVDTAFCFVENFVSDLLKGSGILNQITDAVKTAVSLFSQGAAAIGALGESVFNALDFANGILNFFKCDDDAACPQQQEINLAGVLSTAGDNFKSISNVVNGFSSHQSGGNSSVAVNFQI